MTDITPPRWADLLLGCLLGPEDRQTVPGDLLEEYRVGVLPARGQAAADAWYVRQVLGFVWRATWPWALAFSAAYVGRVALDWLVPPADFHLRATISTAFAVAILLAAGAHVAWRTGSVAGGTLAAVATAAVAALASAAGVGILLSIWHDPSTLNAIQDSGGLDEAFTLPISMVVPALVVGTLGGVVGGAARRLVGRTAG